MKSSLVCRSIPSPVVNICTIPSNGWFLHRGKYFSCMYVLISMPLNTQGVHRWSLELSVQISDIWHSLLQTQIFLVSFSQQSASLCFCFPLCESQSGNCSKTIAWDNCWAYLVFSPHFSGIIVLYCLMSSIVKKKSLFYILCPLFCCYGFS